RTPLAVIRSAGENLADGVVAESEQVRRYGSLIGTEGRRLSEMVERIMEFAGIGSARAARVESAVDVQRLIGEAVDAASLDAGERGVPLIVNASSAAGPLPPVLGDFDALRSAVQNVIGNAVKYSPSGSRVQIDATRTNDRLVISVRDRGIGIDSDDLPHIFKPFYRGRRAVA